MASAETAAPEQFQPPPHVAPESLPSRILFRARTLADFQLNTVYRHLRWFLPRLTGRIVDVGAGQSPFRHLLAQDKTEYVALDVYNADKFGYDNPEIVYFDGKTIPFESESVDGIICTEVLEHVEFPEELVAQMHRVLKPGGRGVITVPWSARFHYIPYDYHRYTPSRLKTLFAAFSSATIEPRGTDLAVIVSKLVVAYLRLLKPKRRAWLPVSLLTGLVLLPFMGVIVAAGHVALRLRLGSTDDPLGYTVWLTK